MRITFVLSSLALSGGVMLVAEYANRLVERGHSVNLVTPANSIDADIQRMLAGDVKIITAARPLPSGRSPLALARLTGSLTAAIPPADVVVATHTPTVLPVFLHTRRHRRVHSSWLYMDYPEMFRGRRPERFLLDSAPRMVEQILTISQPLTDYVTRQTTTPIYTIGAGLPRQELLFNQPRLDAHDGLLRVLYVGDDRPRKGLREFLAAAERVHAVLPEMRLIIVSKKVCAVDTDVPYEFHLQPSHARLSELYRSSTLLVSASWGEGLGYPPLEAMACGTPVVLTDSSGVRDYARNGENCLMVQPRDVEGLADAMARVLDDPELGDRLAEAGRRTASRYGWDAIMDRMEAALLDLAADRAT